MGQHFSQDAQKTKTLLMLQTIPYIYKMYLKDAGV